MNLQVLKILKHKKRLSSSDLAFMAKVSRAAVTRWFRVESPSGWVNVETNTLKNLALGLGVEPALLLDSRSSMKPIETSFLWDKLYPDMESFGKALAQSRLPALARLVQMVGFSRAKKVAGRGVMHYFNTYKKYIHPARRKQCEILYPLYI